MNSHRNTAIYSGTFDPITNGHIDIITRAAEIFPKLIVAVAKNISSTKSPIFSLEERVQMAQFVLNDYPNVIVMPFEGLLVDFMTTIPARIIIRGIRNLADFEGEFQMAYFNKQLGQQRNNDTETIFLNPSEPMRFISSSMVKEIHRLQGDISQWVHPHVLESLIAKHTTHSH